MQQQQTATRPQRPAKPGKLAKSRDDRVTPTGGIARADSLQNVRTGLGIDGRDKRVSAQFSMRPRLSQAELLALWSQSWVAAEIVETVPEHVSRAWVCAEVADDDELSGVLQAEIDRFRPAVKDAWTWARLLGGALILLVVDDGQAPDQPVDWQRVRAVQPGLVVDRWESWPMTWNADPRSQRFGMPEVYAIQFNVNGATAPQAYWHAERVLRFDGNPLPRVLSRGNNGWADSVLERVFDALRDHRQAVEGAAAAAQEFALSVLQIEGLVQELARPDGASALTNRLQEFLLQLRCAGMAVIDKSESYERKGHQVSGLADLIKVLAEDVAGASGIPRAILYGQQGGTTRAGADTDVRAFYDRIVAEMIDKLIPQLQQLARLLIAATDGPLAGRVATTRSADGSIVADFELEPGNLYESDPKAEADTAKVVVDAAVAAVGAGIVSPVEVRPGVLAALGAVEDADFADALTQDDPPADDVAAP